MGKAYSSAAKRASIGPVPETEILQWVGQDPDRARAAVAAEQAKEKPDPELIAALENVLPWFELDGVKFVARGRLKLLDLCEFARAADITAASAEGIAALAEFFEALLGRAEYVRFRKHNRDNDTPDETLLDIMGDLVEEFTARPTVQPSPSAPGLLTTSPTSRVVSLSQGSDTRAPMTPAQFDEWVERMREQNFSSSTPAPD